MRTSFTLLAFVGVAVCSWLTGTASVYDRWHETELERWLSDHSIPYPTPSDRKDLENLVKNNWEDYVVKPYNKWDAPQLSSYLNSRGQQIKKGTEKNKDSLLSQVTGAWYETEQSASDAYSSVSDWMFDSWTESQLKSFLDYHGVPNPTPRTRDSLLQTVRANYQSMANKAGETVNYPGDWIYTSWSESDLKGWLDERGIPAPQPTSRDKMIASIRRNARVASNSASTAASSASASANSAQQSLSDTLLDSWSESQLKEWFDKQGIKVPQGSKKNEMVALARKHSAQLTGNNVSGSAKSAYGAATTSAGNYYAQATDGAYGQFRYYYDWVLNNVGMASKEAAASLSSASSVASVEASRTSSLGSKSASSASNEASKSASSASAKASKAGKKAKDEL